MVIIQNFLSDEESVMQVIKAFARSSFFSGLRPKKENYKRHKFIEKLLRVWKVRNLTIEWKTIIFRILAKSKIVNLALVTSF